MKKKFTINFFIVIILLNCTDSSYKLKMIQARAPTLTSTQTVEQTNSNQTPTTQTNSNQAPIIQTNSNQTPTTQGNPNQTNPNQITAYQTNIPKANDPVLPVKAPETEISSKDSPFAMEILKTINDVRKELNKPDISWSESLEKGSQAYGESLKSEGRCDSFWRSGNPHDSGFKFGGSGEVMAPTSSGSGAVNMWLAERCVYENDETKACVHKMWGGGCNCSEFSSTQTAEAKKQLLESCGSCGHYDHIINRGSIGCAVICEGYVVCKLN